MNKKLLIVLLLVAISGFAITCGYFLHKKPVVSVETYETIVNSSCSTESWSTTYWEDEKGNQVRADTPSAIRKEKTNYEMHCDCDATKKDVVFKKPFNIKVEYNAIVDEVEPCGTYCNNLCAQKAQEYFDSLEQK